MRGVVVALCLAGTPVLAEMPPVPMPEDCEALFTVQTYGCSVSTIYRCDTDAGPQWLNVDLSDDNGMNAELQDSEGNLQAEWTEKNAGFGGYVANTDPVSLSTARTAGLDTLDQTILLRVPPLPEPLNLRMAGKVRRTDFRLAFDDVEFEQFPFTMSATIGAAVISVRGNYLIQQSTGAVFRSHVAIEAYGTYIQESADIVSVSAPGEPGFLAVEPLYGCRESDAAPYRRPA